MISNLPKYYHLASIAPMDEALFKKRTDAINDILKSKNFSWFLDCIRFYLKMPIRNREFEQELFLVINKYDPLFVAEGAVLEKRIFAGAVIGECILRHPENNKIAAALKSAIFGVPEDAIINQNIIDEAYDLLNKNAINIRETESPVLPLPKPPVIGKDVVHTLESLTGVVKGLLQYTKALGGFNDQLNKFFTEKIDVLQEESNIHWWLFRSYSDTLQCAVSDLQPVQAIFVLSQELNSLIQRVPAPNNATAFLKKIWSDVPDKPNEISIKEVIDTLYNTLQDKITSQDKGYEIYGNISPLHLAYQKAKESAGDAAWTSPFEKMSGINADKQFDPYELACQFLNELVLFDL
jgi:hypothetical protein